MTRNLPHVCNCVDGYLRELFGKQDLVALFVD
jgi:hypothetical protein